jgi:hypothetical protein
MISDTFSCGCGYGPWSENLEAETETFAWMRGTITLQTNGTEEMCLELAKSLYSSIQRRIKYKFDPTRVAELLACVDDKGVGTLTEEQQERLFGRVQEPGCEQPNATSPL